MIRKTKVPIKSLDKMTDWLLKNSTGQELDYMNSISGASSFPILVKLFGKFKEYNVYEVFSFLAKDAKELELFRAAKRGEVAAFDAFLLACQAAKLEIKRRREAKEYA